MKVGFVGYAGVGKTTLFTVLTGQEVAAHAPGERHLASVEVIDPRLDHLRELWQPRKFTRARFEVEDEPAVPRGDVAGRGERVAALITPPDYVSQLLVAGPMLLLFEAGLVLAARAAKRRAARLAANEGAQR